MTATGAIGTAMMRSSQCQPTKKEEYDIGVLLVVFGVFLYVAGRITSRLVRAPTRHTPRPERRFLPLDGQRNWR
jgi:hypothetical protein